MVLLLHRLGLLFLCQQPCRFLRYLLNFIKPSILILIHMSEINNVTLLIWELALTKYRVENYIPWMTSSATAIIPFNLYDGPYRRRTLTFAFRFRLQKQKSPTRSREACVLRLREVRPILAPPSQIISAHPGFDVSGSSSFSKYGIGSTNLP